MFVSVSFSILQVHSWNISYVLCAGVVGLCNILHFYYISYSWSMNGIDYRWNITPVQYFKIGNWTKQNGREYNVQKAETLELITLFSDNTN